MTAVSDQSSHRVSTFTGSDSIKELASAMAKAQPLIEGAAKDKLNPHFRVKYADLGAVVDAIRPALAEHGLSFVQIVHDAAQAAKVETLILHSSGEWISCGAISIPVSKHDAQGFGSALTYARRYSLSAAFGVAPEDDDGNAAGKPQQRSQAKPEPGTPKPTQAASQPPEPDRNDSAERVLCDYMAILNECGTLEELATVYQEATKALKVLRSEPHIAQLVLIKDARKAALQQKLARQAGGQS